MLAEKVPKIRLMADDAGKMNLTIKETKSPDRNASQDCMAGREILVVSQFTLYSDASGGNRPSFIKVARLEQAEPIYIPA